MKKFNKHKRTEKKEKCLYEALYFNNNKTSIFASLKDKKYIIKDKKNPKLLFILAPDFENCFNSMVVSYVFQNSFWNTLSLPSSKYYSEFRRCPQIFCSSYPFCCECGDSSVAIWNKYSTITQFLPVVTVCKTIVLYIISRIWTLIVKIQNSFINIRIPPVALL